MGATKASEDAKRTYYTGSRLSLRIQEDFREEAKLKLSPKGLPRRKVCEHSQNPGAGIVGRKNHGSSKKCQHPGVAKAESEGGDRHKGELVRLALPRASQTSKYVGLYSRKLQRDVNQGEAL